MNRVSKKVTRLINPVWIQMALGAFAIIVTLVFLTDLFCQLFYGLQPSVGGCYNHITYQFIKQATSLSFSLTAFLLVGVVVITYFVAGENERLDVRGDEFELILEKGYGGNNDQNHAVVTYYRNFETGDEWQDNSGIERWFQSNSFYHRGEQHRVLRMIGEPNNLELSGRYAVRVVTNEENVDDLKQTYDYHIRGHHPQEDADSFPLGYYTSNEENERFNWLLRDTRYDSTTLKQQLRGAVAYSVSASVIGVVIQGIPWGAEIASNSWGMAVSPSIGSFAYLISSYVFTYIFLGMVHTSVGLLEMLAELHGR